MKKNGLIAFGIILAIINSLFFYAPVESAVDSLFSRVCVDSAQERHEDVSPDTFGGEENAENRETPVFSDEEEEKTDDNSYKYPINIQNNIKVHYIDVGQGDCEFIELPNGEKLLIDAGPSAERVVSYLDSLNIDRIDYVVATHPHADHIGGMAEVLDEFDVGKMYMPNVAHTSKAFENMLDEIEDENIALYTAKAGVSILDADGLKISILSPTAEKYDNLNDYSAVVSIAYGRTRFLFAGDAEASVEGSMNPADVRADVLKVGHHGSKTSSSAQFIKNVSPKHAVISCGKGNSYGHPNDETLATLNSVGAKVYRTDESGTIIITADSSGEISVNANPSVYKKPEPAQNAPAAKQQDAPAAASSQKTPAPQPKPPAKQEPAPQRENSETVYMTKSGKKYHSDGCQYLKKSKIPTTVSKAQSAGLAPCSKCNPPQ